MGELKSLRKWRLYTLKNRTTHVSWLSSRKKNLLRRLEAFKKVIFNSEELNIIHAKKNQKNPENNHHKKERRSMFSKRFQIRAKMYYRYFLFFKSDCLVLYSRYFMYGSQRVQ